MNNFDSERRNYKFQNIEQDITRPLGIMENINLKMAWRCMKNDQHNSLKKSVLTISFDFMGGKQQ